MSGIKTKTELGRHSFVATAAWKDVRDGVVFHDTAGTTRVTKTKDGTVTFVPYSRDGWRLLLRDHRDATTTMIGQRLKPKSERYSFHQTIFDATNKRYQSWTGSGDLFVTAGDYPTIIGGNPNAVAQATERFFKSMRKATHEISGASVLAEAAEAVRGLASPAKALRKEVGSLYQTARNRMYRDRNQSLAAMRDVVSGTWLEWNFGVKPLVSDANAAADALNQLRTRELQAVFPVKGSYRDEELVSQQLNVSFPCSSVQYNNLQTIVGSYCRRVVDWQECTFRGSICVDPRPGADVPLSAQFGVGFEDLAPAAWEVIPWSWMYDYFFNTSAVIDAWTAPLSDLTWANRTIRNGRTHYYDNFRAPPNTHGPGASYSVFEVVGGKAEATLVSFARSSITPEDLRVPLRMKLPGHGTQWANLAALASYGANLRAYRQWMRGR